MFSRWRTIQPPPQYTEKLDLIKSTDSSTPMEHDIGRLYDETPPPAGGLREIPENRFPGSWDVKNFQPGSRRPVECREPRRFALAAELQELPLNPSQPVVEPDAGAGRCQPLQTPECVRLKSAVGEVRSWYSARSSSQFGRTP